MAVRDIEQLFVEEYVPSKTNGRPDYTYAVTALTTSAERQRLVVDSHLLEAIFKHQKSPCPMHLMSPTSTMEQEMESLEFDFTHLASQ